MDTNAVENPKQSDDDLRAGVTRRFVQVVTTVVVQTAHLFLAAGTSGWLWTWVFLGLYSLATVTTPIPTAIHLGTAAPYVLVLAFFIRAMAAEGPFAY